jgi:hypothetical protein
MVRHPALPLEYERETQHNKLHLTYVNVRFVSDFFPFRSGDQFPVLLLDTKTWWIFGYDSDKKLVASTALKMVPR